MSERERERSERVREKFQVHWREKGSVATAEPQAGSWVSTAAGVVAAKDL